MIYRMCYKIVVIWLLLFFILSHLIRNFYIDIKFRVGKKTFNKLFLKEVLFFVVAMIFDVLITKIIDFYIIFIDIGI